MMANRQFRKRAASVLALLAAMLVLSACDEPRFDTSSPETLQKSRMDVAGNWGDDFWPRYEKAIAYLVAAREGWRKPGGKPAQAVLDRIDGDSVYEGGIDEAMFRLANDLARESVKAGDSASDTAGRDLAFELLRDEIHGKSAPELFDMADEALPAVRAGFEDFTRALVGEFAAEAEKEESRYRAFLAEAQKIKIEVFGLRGVSAGLARDAQTLFSFRLTNGTDKAIDRVVFLRGAKEVGLRKLVFDFPTPVAPGAAEEKRDLSTDSGDDVLAAQGEPRFMNVRFADGSWFPRKDMKRSYEEYLEWRRTGWESKRDRLEQWRAQWAN